MDKPERPKIWRFLKSVMNGAFVLLALGLFVYYVTRYPLAVTWNEIKAISPAALLGAAVLVALQLLASIQLEVLALSWLKKPLSYGKVFLAGFVGNAFGRTLGPSVLMGAGIFYQFYSRWGLTASQVGRLMAFHYWTIALGFLAVSGVSLAVMPLPLPRAWENWVPAVRGLGVLFVLLVVIYLALAATRTQPLKIFRWQVPMPGIRLALAQISLSVVRWLLTASILYVLIYARHPLPILSFAADFFAAQLAAIVSHAPGGLGVFDTGLLVLLRNRISGETLTGCLIAYRALFNLIPVLLAVPMYLLAQGSSNLHPRQESN